MNSLYTLALRQESSLESDLSSLSQLYASSSTSHPASTSALHGQINASLAAFDRTIEDYDSMAKREIVDQKRDKALQSVCPLFRMQRESRTVVNPLPLGKPFSVAQTGVLQSSKRITCRSRSSMRKSRQRGPRP